MHNWHMCIPLGYPMRALYPPHTYPMRALYPPMHNWHMCITLGYPTETPSSPARCVEASDTRLMSSNTHPTPIRHPFNTRPDVGRDPSLPYHPKSIRHLSDTHPIPI